MSKLTDLYQVIIRTTSKNSWSKILFQVVEPDYDKVKWSKRGRINQIKLSRVG